MRSLKIFSAVWLLMFMTAISTSYAQMECTCHSKNPAMKHMHETIGFSGCGSCHAKNENLMSARGKQDPDMKGRLADRIKTDKSCVPCHNSNGSIKNEINAGKSARSISGTLYCPKDKLRYSPGTGACSKCGGKLINISEVMEQSRRNPSNGICIDCHTMPEVQGIKRHALFNSSKLQKCLDCHKGHDDCGSCHH